jgi:hypothetical protein
MTCSLLLVALFAIPAVASAQQPQQSVSLVPLQVRVRVTHADAAVRPQARTGTVVRISSDSVVIIDDATHAELTIPLFALKKLERSAGRRSYAGKGALYGAAAGLVTGIAATVAACSLDDNGCDDNDADIAAFVAIVFGVTATLVGTAVGVVVGALIHREKWQEVPLAALQSLSQGRLNY